MKLPVPAAIFDQHVILLGKTRSGKSSVARLLVEHLLDQKKPVCIVDPKGDWWGLRVSASGKRTGYSLVIFGGEHADVPINAHSGAMVAELVATGNRSCIIDLGGWMVSERTQFWIDFASTYFKLHRGRHYLVVDEVHNLCPKGKIFDPNMGKMLYWSNRLASEGLGKGISLIAASQRPQKVHNDFLTSCETLIGMRVIHKADRDAIKDWIDGCGDLETGKLLLNTIASMQRGEGWVWSPEAEFGPKRIQFPLFSTYDSFKAQPLGRIRKLKGWADVDIEAVKVKLASIVKEAEANDPSKLKLQVRTLEAKLRAAESQTAKPVPVSKRSAADEEKLVARGVSVAAKKYRPLLALLEETVKVMVRVNAFGFEKTGLTPEQITTAFAETAKKIGQMSEAQLEKRRSEFNALKREANSLLGRMKTLMDKENLKVDVTVTHNELVSIHPTLPAPRVRTVAPPNADSVPTFNSRQMAILQALAEFKAIGRSPVSRSWIALRADASHKSSAYKNNLSYLRTSGYIDYGSDNTIQLTARGEDMAGSVDVPQTKEEMLNSCLRLLSRPQQAILRCVYAAYPNAVPREELGQMSGASPTSSAFKNNLSALRTAGMIEYAGQGIICQKWVLLVD